jgi:hypothetical protein
MKFIVAILLTALLGFAAGLYLPWWCFALTSAVVALTVHQRAWKAFVTGFIGMFLLWGCLAFFIDLNNNHLLSQKIAGIFKLNAVLLIIITAFIGGLVSGFAALTGSYARKLY